MLHAGGGVDDMRRPLRPPRGDLYQLFNGWITNASQYSHILHPTYGVNLSKVPWTALKDLDAFGISYNASLFRARLHSVGIASMRDGVCGFTEPPFFLSPPPFLQE